MVKKNLNLFLKRISLLPLAASVIYLTLLSLLVSSIYSPPASSQPGMETGSFSLPASPPGDSKPVILRDEGMFGYFMIGDSIIDEFGHTEPGEAIGVIIRFTTPPLAEQMVPGKVVLNQRLKSYKSVIETDHKRFRSDLADIESRMRETPGMREKSIVSSIKREYFTVLNGVALSASRQVIDEMRGFPM